MAGRRHVRTIPATSLLNAVAANGAAATRTFEIDTTEADSLLLVYALAYVAGTVMKIDLYKSPDGGTTYGLVQSIAVAAGTGTLSDYVPTKAVAAASKSIALDLDVRNCDKVKGVCSVTTGGASDLITVTGSLGILR